MVEFRMARTSYIPLQGLHRRALTVGAISSQIGALLWYHFTSHGFTWSAKGTLEKQTMTSGKASFVASPFTITWITVGANVSWTASCLHLVLIYAYWYIEHIAKWIVVINNNVTVSVTLLSCNWIVGIITNVSLTLDNFTETLTKIEKIECYTELCISGSKSTAMTSGQYRTAGGLRYF